MRTPAAATPNPAEEPVALGEQPAATEQVEPDVAAEARAENEATAVFVRRGRSLNLGGIVMLCLVAGAVLGVLWGLMRGVTEVYPLFWGMLYGALFGGGILAFIAVLVDMARERASTRRSPDARR